MIVKEDLPILCIQMGQESMQNRKPVLLMVAGPNGSGKSTLTQFVQRIGRYTNADDIVAATGNFATSCAGSVAVEDLTTGNPFPPCAEMVLKRS